MSKFHDTLQKFRQLPEWVWGHAFTRIDGLQADSEGSLIYAHVESEPTNANLITSRALDVEKQADAESRIQPPLPRRWEEQIHRPLLDLDFEAALIPSSTPGHYHLYLDKPMSRSDYVDLLRALQAAGILQRGFVDSAIGSDLGTTLRLPWIEKTVQELKDEAYATRELDEF